MLHLTSFGIEKASFQRVVNFCNVEYYDITILVCCNLASCIATVQSLFVKLIKRQLF